MGTPFPSPPFLHSGVPGPQRALFPRERTFRCWKDSFIHGYTQALGRKELVDLNLVKIMVWLEIQGVCKTERGPGIFTLPVPWNYTLTPDNVLTTCSILETNPRVCFVLFCSEQPVNSAPRGGDVRIPGYCASPRLPRRRHQQSQLGTVDARSQVHDPVVGLELIRLRHAYGSRCL